MPIGEFRAWARWKLATILGDEDFLDDAQRRMDEYHSGILRRAERVYNYKCGTLFGRKHSALIGQQRCFREKCILFFQWHLRYLMILYFFPLTGYHN